MAKRQFAPSGTLHLKIPTSQQPQTYTQVQDGVTNFVTQIPVQAESIARPLSKLVGLVLDSSGSCTERKHAAELVELHVYFKALGNAKVNLTRLRDHAEATQTFHIVKGNWQALRTTISDWQPQKAVGEYLLVSDGLMNYSSSAIQNWLPGNDYLQSTPH